MKPLVRIEDAKIIIEIDKETLAFATENSPYLEEYYEDVFRSKIKINDQEKWLKSVFCALTRENPDTGETLVHTLFDKAAEYCVELGEEGFEIPSLLVTTITRTYD